VHRGGRDVALQEHEAGARRLGVGAEGPAVLVGQQHAFQLVVERDQRGAQDRVLVPRALRGGQLAVRGLQLAAGPALDHPPRLQHQRGADDGEHREHADERRRQHPRDEAR
jgi:hypothetical protein